MLCFDKLTGKHNNEKKTLKFFFLWEYIFKPVRLSGLLFGYISFGSYLSQSWKSV